MAKDDENALAEALRAPLEAGSLEAALHAARAFFMRHPGHDDAKRVVEALELFMAQVWFGGTGEGGEPDARYATAAQHLESVDFDGALTHYEAIVASDAGAESARRLALRVKVLIAALAGEPLPPPESAIAPVSFDDSTRVAGDGELPLAAFAFDDVTAGVTPHIPPEAYPEEPTRTLMLGDYELLDGPAPAAEEEDDEHTRVRDLSALEAPKPPAPAPQEPEAKETEKAAKRAVRRTRPAGSPDDREVTRVAGAGELPLEELRREMESQADTDLDEMLGSMEAIAPPEPEPAPRPKNEPKVIEERSEVTVGRDLLSFAGVGMPSRSGATDVTESSLVLDITVEDLDFAREAAPPPAVIVAAGEPRGPAVPAPPPPSALGMESSVEPATPAPSPTADAPPPAREPSSPRVRAQARTESKAPLPARISAPPSEPRISYVPLPSAPTPTEPPLPRAPEPVAAGDAPPLLAPASVAEPAPVTSPTPLPAPAAPQASYSKPPASSISPLPNKIDPTHAKPKRAFRPIVKDAPRSTLPSVPPPIVNAPEIAPRGSAPQPARPKPAPSMPVAPPRSSAPPVAPGAPTAPARPAPLSAPPPAPPTPPVAAAPAPSSAAPLPAPPVPAPPFPAAPAPAPPMPAASMPAAPAPAPPMPAAPTPAAPTPAPPMPPAPIPAAPAPTPIRAAPMPAAPMPAPPIPAAPIPAAPMPAPTPPASPVSTPAPAAPPPVAAPTPPSTPPAMLHAPPPAPPPVGVSPLPPAAPAPVGVSPMPPARSSAPPPAPPPVGVPPSPVSESAPLAIGSSMFNVDDVTAPRGPAVPRPPIAPRGPAVPPPPGPRVPAPSVSADPIHAPLETRDVALPAEGQWAIREPGADDTGPQIGIGEPSWTGARAVEATTFEPGAAPIEADSWEIPAAAPASSEERAEAHVARGELREALRMYQELAVSRPDEPHLWERVAQIARMLQSQS